MDKKQLLKTPLRYLRIDINDENFMTTKDAENYRKLLNYIGECYPYKNRCTIGSAYKVIREKANSIMGVTKKNIPLRVSKSEIKSLDKVFSVNNSDFIKIPYKAIYIFQAILELVREAVTQKDLPNELNQIVNLLTYGEAFYKRYLDVGRNEKKHIKEQHNLGNITSVPVALVNDLYKKDSPLQTIFY